MNSFEYTNAFHASQLVAVYEINQTKFLDFVGVAAGVSFNCYLLTMAICCLLVFLFTLINVARPSNQFNLWNIISAILPCFNSQAEQAFRIAADRIRFGNGPIERPGDQILGEPTLVFGVHPRAPALEHSNSLSRCVAIIVASIFVFLCTTYYTTLLLSIFGKHRTAVRKKSR